MATPASAGTNGSPVPAAGNAGDKSANDATAAGDKGTKGAGNKGTNGGGECRRPSQIDRLNCDNELSFNPRHTWYNLLFVLRSKIL